MAWIERHWYQRTPVSIVLFPVGLLYGWLAYLRYLAYRYKLIQPTHLPIPVIIVGNLTVGGSGKTPLVIWLVRMLRQRGYRPGVVTRGYGGQAKVWPQFVSGNSDPTEVGDEPVLIARNADCPVTADPDRVRAAETLVQQGCNIIVSDDGLQHYRLARDLEIAIVDGERRFGNGWCLPSGPLREPLRRLRAVDLRVVHDGSGPEEWASTLRDIEFRRLDTPSGAELNRFAGKTVHAVAGVGNPGRFFARLRRRGINLIEHVFPDHHQYVAQELNFDDAYDIVMTEKDAVKCQRLGVKGWYLAVAAKPSAGFDERVLRLLRDKLRG